MVHDGTGIFAVTMNGSRLTIAGAHVHNFGCTIHNESVADVVTPMTIRG